MPSYDFECESCGAVQEIFRHFSDKLPEKVSDLDTICCEGNSKVFQVYHPPAGHVEGSMSLGSLAEQNSKKLGKKKVQRLTEQYRTKKDNTLKLKEGMEVQKGHTIDKKTAARINKINKMSTKDKINYIQKGEG
jgi:hypothetical protein